MSGRKRHSAEDIVRKLRPADQLTGEGKTGEEVAAELGVSAATLYNWRRAYGGMDTDAAKELKELREQNARLKRLLAEAELGAVAEVGTEERYLRSTKFRSGLGTRESCDDRGEGFHAGRVGRDEVVEAQCVSHANELFADL